MSRDKLVMILRMLLEGVSIRSVERLTGVHRDTIMSVLIDAGQKCERFLDVVLVDLDVADVQADEIWSFVGCKEKTRERKGYAEVFGDCHTFTAIERDTKLILAYHVGKRSPEDTRLFAEKLRRATAGRFQLTTDGYRPYLTAIPDEFGSSVDYATLVKVYGPDPEQERRYSPPAVVDIVSTVRIGQPDEDKICTSHVERHDLTVRMMTRRFTRLTNAFSKCWENHEAALALFFAYYNFCRAHQTLTENAGCKTTPAMQAGLAASPWSLEKLLQEAETV